MVNRPPIEEVAMEGFKCFDDLRLGFGLLTLMTGFNGGGKSTALQPLLLFAQAFRNNSTGSLALNGPLVRLGTAGDIAPPDRGRATSLSVGGLGESLTIKPQLTAGERNLPLKPPGLQAVGAGLSQALSSLCYLGAVRMGAEDAFPIPERIDIPDVGNDGRYAPYWYDRMIDDDVDERRRHPKVEGTSFRKHLDGWLGSLFPGAEANVQNVSALSQMNLQFRLSALGSWRRPSNIGYGLTYAFPILVALMAARENQVIVIDSPESHLHPSAQSEMGRLLATFGQAGVQIIVETHSDHLLNGVRLAVRDQVLDARSVAIHFFAGADGKTHNVTKPTLGPGGEIYEWPDGFFDQGEKDLSRLAGWS